MTLLEGFLFYLLTAAALVALIRTYLPIFQQAKRDAQLQAFLEQEYQEQMAKTGDPATWKPHWR